MQRLSETRRAFLATLGAALPALAANRKRPVVVPPNIILILADALPVAKLGCYGNREAKTPNIDALARRGVHFQNALASGSPGVTGRATLLSGRTPMQAPGSNDVLLSDLLAAKGYDTGYVGAWGLGNDKLPGHGIRWSYTVAGEQMYSNGEAATEQGELGGILSRHAVQFIEQQKAGAKPFFLTIANPEKASIAAIDNEVAAVVNKLRERGLEENTMIVLTATGSTADSLRIPLIYCWPGHSPVEATRPDIVPGYDLFTTLCDAADLTVPDRNLCGRSYLPLVTGKAFPKKNPWRTIVYGSFADPSGIVETASDNRFRLILRAEGKGPNSLLDLRADPRYASLNQYGNRAYITTRDQMRRSLAQWKAQYSR